jgi:hypothetical protein
MIYQKTERELHICNKKKCEMSSLRYEFRNREAANLYVIIKIIANYDVCKSYYRNPVFFRHTTNEYDKNRHNIFHVVLQYF